MNSEVSQRFIKFHKKLIEEGKVKSSRQFALSLDYAPQSFSDMIKGKRDVTIELIRKAREIYKVNTDYLFSGEGEMEIEANHFPADPIVTVVTNNEGIEQIVHVPVPAQAGYGGQLYDQDFIRELPTFSMPGHHFMTGTHRCFDIDGDSMEPTLFAGEKVVCSLVERDYWINSLRDNCVYVIVTDSSVVLKRLVNNLSVDQKIVLISDNTYYDKYEVPLIELKEIWKVDVRISPFNSTEPNRHHSVQEEIEKMHEIISQQSDSINSLNRTLELLLKKSRNAHYS